MMSSRPVASRGVSAPEPSRSTGMSPLRLGRALVTWVLVMSPCAVGTQSDWKRIVPVARGDLMQTPTSSDPATPVRAVRLIFEYEGDRVRLLQEQPVEVAAGNLHTASADEAGIFIDVRDASNRTLARVHARGAMVGSVEVFPERHDEPIVRKDVPQVKGAFTVVVPAPAETDHATLVRVPPAPAGEAAGARGAREVVDLVSFPIKPNK